VSVNFEALGARVTIARESDGTSRVFALERDDRGDYVSVAQSPDEGFPPPLFIGPDQAQRADVRTRQTEWSTGVRGMGADELDETQGTSSFRYSQWDTRFPNVRVLRPLPVRLGSSTTVGSALGVRVVYVGSGTAKWFAYGGGSAKYYSTSTSQWVDSGLTNTSPYLARGSGGIFFVHNNQGSIGYSTDAITWNAVSVASITAALGTTIAVGLAVHDQKLFTLGFVSGTSYALMQSANPTSGAATWTRLGTLTLDTGENPYQLFVWKFPPQPERGGLFCLTNHKLYWYDDTADAASVTAWKEWHAWDIPYPVGFGFAHALRHGGTGDLYVMPHYDQDSLWQFTGSTITSHSPNKRGGLPPARQGVIITSASNARAIVCWVVAGTSIGSGNSGMVVAFNEQEGWHHLLDTTNTAIIGSSKTVRGGGLGTTSIVTVLSDGVVWEQDFFDTAMLPQYATTARSYDSTALDHDSAKTDIGSSTLKKAGLYVEANAKIPSGGSIEYLYRADDTDLTGSFTSLGTATSSTAMPYRVGFPAGTTFKQIEIRERGTRGTAASATPIVYSTIVHATLLPPARFNTAFSISLRPAAYGVKQTEAGYGLAALRDWLLATHGQIVSFTVSHPGESLTLARGQMVVSPTLDPVTALGRVTVQIRDLTTPSSG
jgi:hypothetical protein